MAQLDRAIAMTGGSITGLSTLCGFSHTTIWRAKERGKLSPAIAAAIQVATKGRVSQKKLCPEIFARRRIKPRIPARGKRRTAKPPDQEPANATG